MEHRQPPNFPEHSPHDADALQLEKNYQYLLFLLANDLDYDTHDVAISGNTEPEDSNTEAAMNSPRYLVTLPPHKKRQQPGRTVAIYPDITLVLDTQAVQQCSSEQHMSLESYTKEELLDFIKQDPACGLELSHGQRFTASMVDALTHPIADVRVRITEAMKLERQQHTDRTRRSLGKVTIHRAAGELGIAPQTVEKALDDPAIHEKLGKIATTQHGTELQHLLTPRQVAILAEHLQSTPPPEGYRTLHSIAKKLRVSGNTVRRIIDELNGAGVNIQGEEYQKATGLSYCYYSPTDQRKIENQARKAGLFGVAPEGYLPCKDVAESLHATRLTINKAIKALNITPKQYRTQLENGQPSHKRGYHLSPRQAEQVAAYLGRSLGVVAR